MNDVPDKAGHTLKRPAFNAGVSRTPSKPANSSRSGGEANAVPYDKRESSNGGSFNKGRFSGGSEKHYNGGTHSIPKGSTAVPR